MTEIVKEKVTVQNQGPTAARITEIKSVATGRQTFEYLIYFVFGILEVLLVFRLVLKLMGANPGSSFVSFIYGLTGVFILPFEGIFRSGISEGIETGRPRRQSIYLTEKYISFIQNKPFNLDKLKHAPVF